jgi:hypothetical protein
MIIASRRSRVFFVRKYLNKKINPIAAKMIIGFKIFHIMSWESMVYTKTLPTIITIRVGLEILSILNFRQYSKTQPGWN